MAAKPTSKPKITPTPKPTLPSLAEYKKSAAYRTGSQTYKEYLDIAKQLQNAKKK